MRYLKQTLMMAAALIALSAPAVAASDKNTYDRYKVIFERNIFSKDRRPPRPPAERKSKSVTKVIEIYVLRGISAEAGRNHRFALIEEQVSAQSKMVGIGADILAGRIVDIQADGVLFENNGDIQKIKIGDEFGQNSATVEVEAEAANSETEPPAENKTESAEETTPAQTETQNTETKAADENDVLKKLMERRKREMGS